MRPGFRRHALAHRDPSLNDARFDRTLARRIAESIDTLRHTSMDGIESRAQAQKVTLWPKCSLLHGRGCTIRNSRWRQTSAEQKRPRDRASKRSAAKRRDATRSKRRTRRQEKRAQAEKRESRRQRESRRSRSASGQLGKSKRVAERRKQERIEPGPSVETESRSAKNYERTRSVSSATRTRATCRGVSLHGTIRIAADGRISRGNESTLGQPVAPRRRRSERDATRRVSRTLIQEARRSIRKDRWHL